MKTLRTTMTDNIGQVTEQNAGAAIKRMNQQTGKVWRKDYSEQMYVEDELDDEVFNPAILHEGLVWITCTPEDCKSPREQAIEWWNSQKDDFCMDILNDSNYGNTEITAIWRKETNQNFKEFLDIIPDELIYIDDDKDPELTCPASAPDFDVFDEVSIKEMEKDADEMYRNRLIEEHK